MVESAELARRAIIGAAHGALHMITAWMNAIGAVIILVGMSLVCADVVARNVFNAPMFGVIELVKMTIIAIIFLGVPHAILTGSMIRSDMVLAVLGRRSPRGERALNTIHMIAGALFFAAIVWGVWPQLMDAIRYDTFVGLWVGFRAPVWPIRTVIVGGAALGCVAYLINALYEEQRRPG